MYLEKVKGLTILILFILIINVLFLTACDIWMKPMVPFIEEATSVTVIFVHPDNGSESILRTHFGRKITAPEFTRGGYEMKWYNESSNKAWLFEYNTANKKIIKLYGKWIPSLIVGEEGPGGGIIYYRSETGFIVQGTGTGSSGSWPDSYTAHYLEAAPSNIERSNITWASANHLIPSLSQNSIDTTDWVIGRGRLNTAIIIAHGSENSYNTLASSECIVLSQGGKNDWFLPSIDELDLFYQSNVHDITTGGYWASSQRAINYALYFDFGNGVRDYMFKINTGTGIVVRAIRAF